MLLRSMEDQGADGPAPSNLQALQDYVMTVGADMYDERIPVADGFKDPLTQNWLVNPVVYGASQALLNKASVQYLREEAKARGRAHVVHPMSNERIGVDVEPIPNSQAGSLVETLYRQLWQTFLSSQASSVPPTNEELGRAQGATQAQRPSRSRS